MIVSVLHHRLSIKAGVTADLIPPKNWSGPDTRPLANPILP